MLVIPAIDLMDGKVVRLEEGKRERLTVFHDRPWQVARDFADQGATCLHVVDLDGAFAGARKHADVIARMARESGLPLQVGGGLRDRDAVANLLSRGAQWAVLGTMAIKNPTLAEALCQEFSGQIIVAVDAKDGKVATEGWREDSDMDARTLAKKAATWGAARILYTDIARDGIGVGPNVFATAELQNQIEIPVIASGGIGSLRDLCALATANVKCCVVGRALYDGVFTLQQAIEAGAC